MENSPSSAKRISLAFQRRKNFSRSNIAVPSHAGRFCFHIVTSTERGCSTLVLSCCSPPRQACPGLPLRLPLMKNILLLLSLLSTPVLTASLECRRDRIKTSKSVTPCVASRRRRLLLDTSHLLRCDCGFTALLQANNSQATPVFRSSIGWDSGCGLRVTQAI